ncbi:HBR226Wp [Eremothecium sinecaudum]|uniref:HBR226Wp n=1 Tax=Eremothecium sinecaudum TaxID=45286 RepID=A0A120K191_9SACH|nr:HBR226Wp [Eremothecium sinecaudum]AMD19127.1 HBR226Wp [Eremothecium sinecaudum]
MRLEYLATWLFKSCVIASVFSVLLSALTMLSQLMNYRIPQQQRLILRIQLLVPIFSITCLLAIIYPNMATILIDPIREVYESFVIYTFFSLLTLLLGGERNILVNIAPKQNALRHPIPVLGRWILPAVDLSDPKAFLAIKRGILQYVWFKPIYCLGMSICQQMKWKVGIRCLVIAYNASASWSLYDLALFWKCLYHELAQYNPWPKFLCVKLIIFASYWQGMIIDLLQYFNVISERPDVNMGYIYQNTSLCLEMIVFALAHRWAFPWTEYSARQIPMGARMKFYYALRDWLGWKDLAWDFKTTFKGSEYTYRNFAATEANSERRQKMINDGLRYTNFGTERHWIKGSPSKYGSITSDEDWLDLIEGIPTYIPEDSKYPVIWDASSRRYTRSIVQLRETMAREFATSLVGV